MAAEANKAALDKLFNPQSIAIIGATQDRRRVGGIALDHLVDFGYEGDIYPINPKYQELFGLKCYPDIASVPQAPDLAVLSVAAPMVLGMLEQCHARGVQAAVVYASGFAEESAEGARLQEELVSFAARTGMVVSGPNCMGHANLNTRAITAFATLFKDFPPPPAGSPPGDTALVTQSGNVCAMLYAAGRGRGIAFNHFINTGNEACLEFSEYLEWLAADPQTRGVMGYLEGLRDGERFVRVARQLHAANKPLALIKVGDSEQGAKAAQSHTAALSGDHAVYRAAFRQLGVMLADEPAHLVDLAYLLSFRERSAGRRLAVASVSGAMGALMTDLLTNAGAEIPTLPEALQQQIRAKVPAIGTLANPIDLTAQIFNRAGVATEVVAPLASSDMVDTLVVYATGYMLDRIADELIAVAGSCGKLIVVIDSGKSLRRADLESAGMPVFDDVGRCVRALATFVHWSDGREAVDRWGKLCDAQGAKPVAGGLPAGTLDEFEVKQWLAGHGVPVAREAVAASADEAAAWAAQSTQPVAVKVLSPDIAHKTEVGGVVLNLHDAAAVRAAFSRVCTAARERHPEARLRGALVQRMEQGVCELIVGVTRDAVFGPVLTVGLGGVFTELFRDVSHRVLPVDESMALEMLKELRAYPLLAGFRGKPAADVAAACQAIVAISHAAQAAGPACQELEVNPLLVRRQGEGAIALDALVVGPQGIQP